jgi:hypothetical protein
MALIALLLAPALASASSGILSENSRPEKNLGQAEIHRVSAGVNAEKHRVCDDFYREHAADYFVWAHNSACAIVDSKTPSSLYGYTRGSYMQVQLPAQGSAPAYSQTWWVPASMMPVSGKPVNPAITAAATIDQTANIGNILQTQAQQIADGWASQSDTNRYGNYFSAISTLLANINALLPTGATAFTLDGIDRGTETLKANYTSTAFNDAVNTFYQRRGFYIGTAIHNQLAQWLTNNPIAGLSYSGPNTGPDFVYTTTNSSGQKTTVYFEVLTRSKLSLSVHADKPYSGNLWRAVFYNFPTTQGIGP